MKNTKKRLAPNNMDDRFLSLQKTRVSLALLILLCITFLFFQGCSRHKGEDTGSSPQTTASEISLPSSSPEPTPEPIKLNGRSFSYDETAPDFTGLSCNAEDVARVLSFLENPLTADLSDSDFSTEIQLDLVNRFSGTDFIWTVDVFGLPTSSQTETLELNKMKFDGVDALEELLPLLPHLKQVNMLNCPGEDEEIYRFTLRHPETRFVWTAHLGKKALPTDITSFCRNIDYERTTINDEYLDVQLRYFPDLIALDVGHGKDSITRCDWLQYAPKLKYLIIAICQIKDITPVGELENLRYLEVFTNPELTDISPLGKLKNLETLNISNLEITDYTPLYSCTSLKNCWINMNNVITDEQLADLQSALPDCKIKHTSNHPTADGWRKMDAYFEMRDAFGAKYQP